MTDNRVVIAGAGPAGLVAATLLARAGVAVTVLEAEPSLPLNLRASTFHPPTLDMLDDLGVAAPLIAQGLKAPTLQYRDRATGLIAQFDFGGIADLTRHPYRLQCEQFRMNQLLLEKLKGMPACRSPLRRARRRRAAGRRRARPHSSPTAGGCAGAT